MRVGVERRRVRRRRVRVRGERWVWEGCDGDVGVWSLYVVYMIC